MLLHVLWAGVIPAVLVARVQIVSSNSSRLKIVLGRILMVFAAIALLLLMVASSYKDLSLWGRQNREVRVYATPSYPIYSVFARSEEHTSELQSLMRISYAVFCLQNKKRLQDNK